MTAFVAGVGNVFFGDDGFGVEVARQLAAAPPPDTSVADFGIRALHLAYELCRPCSLCIVADCVARGGAPGTLYVIDPVLDEAAAGAGDAHGMDLRVVFATARELGGTLPAVLVVGCEPAQLEPGIGLSPRVARAVPAAAALIRELVSRRTAKESS
jgi:hydrogenase maturation protease